MPTPSRTWEKNVVVPSKERILRGFSERQSARFEREKDFLQKFGSSISI